MMDKELVKDLIVVVKFLAALFISTAILMRLGFTEDTAGVAIFMVVCAYMFALDQRR